ncbi:GDSL family lipase [Acetobacteraceae bacterium H6797]|nr:GDSL family lipase [Acetobacteraceae bacterium H6797]
MAVSGQAALAAEACPGLPLRQPPPREAIPAAFTEPQWVARNNQLEQQMAGANFSRTRLLFLGDSITESWPPNLYQHFYGHRGAFNMGVRSDNTMGMLWRLPRAPLGRTLKPQLVVLLLGTNNIWPGAKPEDVATGIAEVVRQIRRQSPTSRVLLVGVLPRGADASEPARPVIAQVNALLAGCADNSTVFFANPGPMLLDGQGVLSEQMSPDRLHLTWLGYAILGAGLEPDIRRILGE